MHILTTEPVSLVPSTFVHHPPVHKPCGDPLWRVERCQAASPMQHLRQPFSALENCHTHTFALLLIVMCHLFNLMCSLTGRHSHSSLSLSLFVCVCHMHTHHRDTLSAPVHGGNQKVSWLRAGIKQMHLIEQTPRDGAKTTAVLTFHVLTDHPSDNSLRQKKFYKNCMLPFISHARFGQCSILVILYSCNFSHFASAVT